MSLEGKGAGAEERLRYGLAFGSWILYGCNLKANLSSYTRPFVLQRRSRWARTHRRSQIILRRLHPKLPSQQSFNWTESPPFPRSFVLRGPLRSPAPVAGWAPRPNHKAI